LLCLSSLTFPQPAKDLLKKYVTNAGKIQPNEASWETTSPYVIKEGTVVPLCSEGKGNRLHECMQQLALLI